MTTFGEKLRALMAERRVSQRRLARLVPCNDGYLSRVARDEKTPSQRIAERLDELLDAAGELAALRTPPPTMNGGLDGYETERLVLTVRNPARLDGAVIEGLAATLASQRRIEDVVGSGAVLDAARSHLALVLRLMKEARGPRVSALAAHASEASQFTGWLSTATDAHGKAGPLYDQALRLGLQAGDDDLAATALSMRGHLAWATGDYADMDGLSEAAADMATATGTRTVATQQRGRALAILGDRQGALRAIGQAEDLLAADAGGSDPDGLYFYGPTLLTMQRGLITAYLADSPAEYTRAAELITGGIEAMPESVRHSEWVAWYRVQAAGALAAAGGVEASVAGLLDALGILAATGGTKTRKDIVRVRQSLVARWPGHPDVAELSEAYRELCAPAGGKGGK